MTKHRSSRKIVVPFIILCCILLLGGIIFYAKYSKSLTKWHGAKLIGHAFGAIDDHNYTNSYEAFLDAYQRGLRTFEVDFSTTSDGRIVLRHDWKSRKNMQPGIDREHIPTLEVFKSIPLYEKYTPMSLEDLYQLMKDYPDIWIVTDSKATKAEDAHIEFQEIVNEAKEFHCEKLLNRMIVQIYNEDMLDAVNSVYPFSYYIFTLYTRWDGEDIEDYENICKWSVEHNISILTMYDHVYTDEVRDMAFRYGLEVYVHTINDPAAAQQYLNEGVRGLYTDDINTNQIKTPAEDGIKAFFRRLFE